MQFNPEQTAFGRHETFPLRFGWLTKGFQALEHNATIFNDENATVHLGVGKNMVNAIHYWLQAAGLIRLKEKSWQPTILGSALFSQKGWDPYLEDEATIWLIHWLFASNPQMATAIFWFFNSFHKPQFTEAEVFTALKSFVKTQVKQPKADNTLKIEVNMILRMYTPKAHHKGIPSEDALDSPLSMLGLIQSVFQKNYLCKPEDRLDLPSDILGFAISQLFKHNPRQSGLPIHTLLQSDGYQAAPGAVFRLTENNLLTHIEQLLADYPQYYALRETAGLHQLYRMKPLEEIEPMYFLEQHYLKIFH
jgi:hypothetical protein